MRIAHIVAFYLPSQGGMQYYVRNLTRALAARGHCNTIMTVNTEGVATRQEAPEGIIHRYNLDMSYHRGLVSTELVARLLNMGGYDALHVHIPFPLGLEAAVLGAQLRRIPVVVTHHGTGTKDDRLYSLIAGAYDRVYRQGSLRLADRIVFLTESYRDQVPLSRSLRMRSSVVRTGVDIARFHPDIDGSGYRHRYGLAPSDTVGVWVGSLSEHNRYKGVNYLIAALTQMEKAHVKLLIVGDGPLQDELRRQAATLGVAARVYFAGAVANEDLPGHLAAADFFVLPSIRGPENAPLVVFEAMATGKAVIASDLAGVREIIEDGRTGLLVPPHDADALCAAIERLTRDLRLRVQLGQGGRLKAETHSWDACAAEMERIYSSTGNVAPGGKQGATAGTSR